MYNRRCTVPLCDIRQLLPLSGNSVNITDVATILLKTGDKFTHSGSANSLKRKQQKSSLKEKSVESDSGDGKSSDSVSDSGDDQNKRDVLKHKGHKKVKQNKGKREDRKHKEQKEKKAKYKEKREDRKHKEQEEKKEKHEEDESNSCSDYAERSTDSNSDSEEDESDSDYEKCMNPYEKLIEKKRKENFRFLESLEIGKVKADLSEAAKKAKKDKKPYTKIEYPPASRKSKRTANVILNYSEEKLLKDVWGKVERDVLYADKLARPGKRSERLADKDYDFSEFFE